MKLQHHVRATTAGTLVVLAAATLLSGVRFRHPRRRWQRHGDGHPHGHGQPPSASKTSSAPKTPTSDVKGRDYDFGVVTKTGTEGGVGYIELDRWTWKKLDDAKLAKDGVPTAPFKGAVPYKNQNAKLTYTIPLADGARILFHHCSPPTSRCRPSRSTSRPEGPGRPREHRARPDRRQGRGDHDPEHPRLPRLTPS